MRLCVAMFAVTLVAFASGWGCALLFTIWVEKLK